MNQTTYTATLDSATTLDSTRMPDGFSESDLTKAHCDLLREGRVVAEVRDYEFEGKTYTARHSYEVLDGKLAVSVTIRRHTPSGRSAAVRIFERKTSSVYARETNDAVCDSLRALIEVERRVLEIVAERNARVAKIEAEGRARVAAARDAATADPFAPTSKEVRVYRIVGALRAHRSLDSLGATETELADAHRMMRFAASEDYDRWARIVRAADRKAADATLYDSRTGYAS